MARVAKPLKVALTEAGPTPGLIIDIALGQRRRHQRGLHENDFHVQAVGRKDSPVLAAKSGKAVMVKPALEILVLTAPLLGLGGYGQTT